jgi:phage repressor protein C with HTH and peptisase S24 domain
MSDLKTLVEEKLDQAKRNPFEAARSAGLERSFVNDILIGKKRSVSGGNIQKLAAAIDASANEIIAAMGKGNLTDAPAPSPYAPEPNAEIQAGPAYLPARAMIPNDVPELGLMVGGSGDDDSVFEFNGTTVDYHPRPPGLARRPNVFVLRVSNSSMSPRFEDGDIEYIELRNPSVGEYVVVEEHPKEGSEAGRSFIKRLVKADARKIVVEQFNPHGFMEFGRNEIRRLFRVITDKKELIG